MDNEKKEEIRATSGHKASENHETNILETAEKNIKKSIPKIPTNSGGKISGGNHTKKPSPKTISFAKGKGNLHHNNRDFIAKNVDRERTEENIEIKRESLQEAYQKNFGEAIKEYNASQKRKDRHKSVKKYIDEIKKQEKSKGGTKLFYEQVIQLGTQYDTGNKLNPEEAEKASQVLLEYMQDFEKRNPNLYVFNAVIHRDEATPHLHIDYIPVAREGAKRGLKVRNSFAQALREQGITIDNENKKENEFTIWRKRETEILKEIAEKHKISIKEFNKEKRQHLTPDEYRELGKEATEQAKKEVLQELTELEQKNFELQKANEILQEKLQQQKQTQVVHPEAPNPEKVKKPVEPEKLSPEKTEPARTEDKQPEPVKTVEKPKNQQKPEEPAKIEPVLSPVEQTKSPGLMVDTHEKPEEPARTEDKQPEPEQKPEIPDISPEQKQLFEMQLANLEEEKNTLAEREKIIEDNIFRGNNAQLQLELKMVEAQAKEADAYFWQREKYKKEFNKLVAAHKSNAKKIAEQQKLLDETRRKMNSNAAAAQKIDLQLHPEKNKEQSQKKAMPNPKILENTKARSPQALANVLARKKTLDKSRGGFSR